MIRNIYFLFFLLIIFACKPSNVIVKNDDLNDDKKIVWGIRDTSIVDFDGSGDGVFGRKIIYRDLSATKKAIDVSGKIAIRICINTSGLVTYAEIIGSESTINDREVLKRYLTAARGYKFQPDLTAPIEQCGKLKFTINNSVHNKLR